MRTNIILWNTKYGEVRCCLKKLLRKYNMSEYQLSRISGVRYEVISRYSQNAMTRYDAIVLAKICFALNCEISDLLVFKR